MAESSRSFRCWIRGQRWRTRVAQPVELDESDPDYVVEGDCNHHTRTIRISLGLAPKRFLYVAIHECLHALLPDYSEEAIIELSHGLTNYLWRFEWIWNAKFKRMEEEQHGRNRNTNKPKEPSKN